MDSDPDYPALLMANYLFGSAARRGLWTRIRESAWPQLRRALGHRLESRRAEFTWTVSAIFAPQNQAKVEAALREELAKSVKDGFTQKELDEARGGLLNLRRLSRAQDGSVANVPRFRPAPRPHLRVLAAHRRRDHEADARAGQRRVAQVRRPRRGSCSPGAADFKNAP
jgi:hypothetical protein